MAKTYFGVDISEHNGTVDWAKVAKKVDFAILRIGWVGNNSNCLDKKFKENYAAAKKAGVKIGAYVYMYSKSTTAAKSGAEWVLAQIKGCSFDMPIYCDMEDSSIAGLGKTTLTSIADTFNQVIKRAGYTAGIYANLDWFTNKLNASIKSYTTWIAHYTTGTNKYQGAYDMWQNSSKGKVDGVNGNVDTNYLYKEMFTKVVVKPATGSKNTTTTNKTATSSGSVPTFKVGSTYELTTNVRVRTGAGTNYAQKKRSQLTADGQKNALNQTYAVLKKGTKFTVLEIKKNGSDIWVRIPSGWICVYYKGEKYAK
jgi:GH25 family lysozyme M1 (1,4-beta-N-acetylmuramidase)